jgi:creatinine amidohydrolase
MLLQEKTWAEVESYLKTSTGIIMPIGSTEQHGPNGLLGTDALCAEVIGRGVGTATGALVAPTIHVGMAQHHMGFTGTMTLKPSTLINVIGDYVESLAKHGFTRFFFVNGHGGNMATIKTAFDELYTRLSLSKAGNEAGVRCRLRNWWESAPMAALSAEMYGDKEGTHATPSEVSVTQYAFPDAIKACPPLSPAPKPQAFHDAADFRRRFPDGRIGSDPSLSTPADGKRIFDAAVKDIAGDYKAFAAE